MSNTVHQQSIIPPSGGPFLLQPGDSFGEYVVEEPLGAGSLGEVYGVKNQKGDHFALKILNARAWTLDEDDLSLAIYRLRNEQTISERLGEHPHLLHVLKYGNTDGIPFIICELLVGLNLKQYLEMMTEDLPVATILEWTIQVCEGLAYMHSKDVLHRDIKSANLFLDHNNAIKLIDFGLSRHRTERRRSNARCPVGTRSRMSPELWKMRSNGKRHPGNERTEVWAMGTVLYELCTGRLPWNHTKFPRDFSEPPDPSVFSHLDLKGIPDILVEVVTTCLHLDPSMRYQRVKDLQRELRAIRAYRL